MRCFPQITAAYLGLCLALAGATGLSPVLHRLLEHGNHGPAHTHSALAKFAASPDHDPPHPAGHIHLHRHQTGHSSEPFATAREVAFPLHSLARLWRAWSDRLAGDDGESSPSPTQAPGHTHDSLPQMLLSGLIEQPIDVPLLPQVRVLCDFQPRPAHSFCLVRDLDPQTASRPPPLA